MPHPTFVQDPITLIFSSMMSNYMALEVAVEAVAEILIEAEACLVARPRLLVAKACNAFVELAGSCGYAFAVMLVAKGLVLENFPRFMGLSGEQQALFTVLRLWKPLMLRSFQDQVFKI
ncbi:hypothetical protein GH714_043850 [Hevea brasiliensis]|uniref:Uncharacterized protein n=1 Tax=Hevea brasiliensis TaxID=3981 RepID=A0A6A6K0H7_HEVBR|nr:hypothetical protein GH714_043850 [Hevea brasiliensis]